MRSAGLIGWVARHRAAVTLVLLLVNASPAGAFDDRQLLKANAGAFTNVLIILDSSTSMLNDFGDRFRLPAYMDDFLYPQGTFPVEGSKFAVAKSALREVISATRGVNWAFSYYRNPDQRYGAAWRTAGAPSSGTPDNGATKTNDKLRNGGMEFLYFACGATSAPVACAGSPSSVDFTDPTKYPDIQTGRFLEIGHKVMRNYELENGEQLPNGTFTGSRLQADNRDPYSNLTDTTGTPRPGDPVPGTWRGAFGPFGDAEMVIYRHPNNPPGCNASNVDAGPDGVLGTADDVIPTANPCNELRMKIINRNFPTSGYLSDTDIFVDVTEWGPPPATPTPVPPTATFTPTSTFTPTNTPTRTQTLTPSKTFTQTNTPIPPTATNTFTVTKTPTATKTFTRTNTAVPPTKTFTQTRTPTRTFTRTGTPPTNTPTQTATKTFTQTSTFTAVPPTNTFTKTLTPTISNTPTITNTPVPPTFTFTPSQTFTPSKTFTQTATRTFTIPPTSTFTNTRTFTPTMSPTPTLTPTDEPAGRMPAQSHLPVISNWLSAAMRGMLAMAPPPPPPPPPASAYPCVGQSGIPARYDPNGDLRCAPCQSYQPGWICAFADKNANGVDDGPGGSGGPESRPLPDVNRGFDDPQADPRPGFVPTGHHAVIQFRRADLMDLGADRNGGGNQTTGQGYLGNANRANPPCPNGSTCVDNGNPPWGSGTSDADADGVLDSASILSTADRHNQGMYGSSYDQALAQSRQQFPMDAAAARSSCFGAPDPCNPYTDDCGGMAHFYQSDGTTLMNAPDAPDGSGNTFVPYTSLVPPSKPNWPVVPFQRGDWTTNNPNDAANVPVMKRLLRFVSSLVKFDPNETNAGIDAYSLAENANNVVMPAPGTPVAGVLLDAYNYFKNTVFVDALPVAQGGDGDPAASCRRYVIVYITDGIDECNSGPPDLAHPTRVNRSCSGPGLETVATSGDLSLGDNTSDGVAGDLGRIKLPENVAGDRATAHTFNPQIQTNGVPVYMVSLGGNPSVFNCIAEKSDPQDPPAVADTHVLGATDRAGLVAALNSILTFVQTSRFFAAPSVPAFATGTGAVAQIGAVIPSHVNEDGSASSWAIWAGSLKAYRLDAVGQIPTVTATGTPVPTATGTPVATAVPTVTPNFPDEGSPDDASILTRRPVWNAARVLGYTDPVTQLAPNQAAVTPPASPSSKPGPVQVWPGRRMIWAKPGASLVPLSQQNFVPDNGSGAPDPALVTALSLTPVADQTLAIQTIQFLRGGATTNSTGSAAPGPTPTPSGIGGPPGSRDEILNQLPAYTASGAVGPGFENQYSYWFWDDAPPPGQARPDSAGVGSTPTPGPSPTPGGPTPPPGQANGYPHKLGDIFHSDVVTLEPPKYFQYLVGDPNNYVAFATTNQFRRKVVFAGANDGFLHAFDGGVWGRDAAFPSDFDLGTGREIFAYAPAAGAASSAKFAKFPPLLNFPPSPSYFADGPLNHTDAFVDPTNNGSPTAANRKWRTLLVGGLRQGGHYYYALDVTQPDQLDAAGHKSNPKDNSPDCLMTLAGTFDAVNCVDAYPQVRWEFTDNPAVPTLANPALGETWSRPVLGRIRIKNLGNSADTDRYVAIFGGGYDPNYLPGTPLTAATQGRAIYIVNLETGLTLAKLTQADCLGAGCATSPVDLAPVAAGMAAADYDDDGYLDAAYVGDMNGRMIRVDLSLGGVGATCSSCGAPGEKLSGYQPFVLFDASTNTNGPISPATTATEPIFLDAGIVFLQGGSPPKLGISFGTGFRPDLVAQNDSSQRFYLVDDGGPGVTTTTLHESDLKDLTPPGPNANIGTFGFYINYENNNEKTVSSVFSTLGQLSLITFTPNSVDPCTTGGVSYSYRFLYSNGQAGYTPGSGVDYGNFRLQLGGGLVSGSQSTTEQGILDTTLFTGGSIGQNPTTGGIRTINRNWREVTP